MEAFPIVKLIEYEEWLQGYLNAHPKIGDIKLLKALEESMNVTCSRQTMQTWLGKHSAIVAEPDIADYEDFLSQQLASKPNMGYKLLCGSLKKAKGVTIREGPMRTWLSAHKKSSASIGTMPVHGNSSSSSGPAMAELDLPGLGDYSEYLRQQLLEAPDSTVVAMRM